MPRRLWIVALLLGAVGLLAFWLLLGKVHRFAYWTSRKTQAQVEAMAKSGWRSVRIEPEPGIGLWGLVRKPATGNRWVLFLPANSTDLLAGFRSVLDDAVPDQDIGIAFWAWRGFEASDGTPSPAALQQDAAAMARHLVEVEGARPADIEIWSYSLGTAMAVDLAARWCTAGTPPRRLVLWSPYTAIAVMPAGTFGRLHAGDRYDALAHAAEVTCPVLIVHGTRDDALPVQGARELGQALGGTVRLFEMPDRGHVDWLSEIRTWLHRAEAEAQPAASRPK